MNAFRSYMKILRTLEAGELLSDEQIMQLPALVADSAAIAATATAGMDGDAAAQHRAFLTAAPSAEALFSFLDGALERLITRDDAHLAPLGARGRLYGWYWGYWGRALVHGYEASREERFLRLFIESYDRLLELRDDALGLEDEAKKEVLGGWGTALEHGIRANEVTVAGLMALPVCELLLLLDREPALAERYQDARERYLESVKQTLAGFEPDFRTADGIPGGYYVVPGTEQVEALNHTHLFAAAAALLYALTGEVNRAHHLDEVRQWFLASVVREANGTWSWLYCPTPERMIGWGEEMWKGGVTVEFPFAAHRAGFGFDDSEMDAMADTFVKNVVLPDGTLNKWISSTRRGQLTIEIRERSLTLPGCASPWVLAADRRPDVLVAFLKMLARNPELFPGGWFDGARQMTMVGAWLMHRRPSATGIRDVSPASVA